MLLLRKDPAAARALHDASRAELEEELADDPESGPIKQALATNLYRLATACLRAGDAEASARHYARCLEIRRGLLPPGVRDAKREIDLMISLARCGQVAEAVRFSEALAKAGDQDAQTWYQVACARSLCRQAVRADAAESARHAEASLAALREASLRGYKDIVYLENDPDLDPLRDMPEFGRELEAFRAAAEPKPAG